MDRRYFFHTLGAGAAALHTPLRAQAFESTAWPRGLPTPTIDALDLQGRRVTLADFRGRALVLNFWASWCEPCRAEMPTLQQLPAVFGEDRLAVVGVNFKESPQRIARFVQPAGFTLPVWLDPRGEVARAWGVNVFPSTVLIDRTGRVRQRIRGEVDWSGTVALGWIDRLLSA